MVFTSPWITSADAGAGLRRKSSIRPKIFWNKLLDSSLPRANACTSEANVLFWEYLQIGDMREERVVSCGRHHDRRQNEFGGRMIRLLEKMIAQMAEGLVRRSPRLCPTRRLGLLAILCIGALPAASTVSLAEPVECRPWPSLSDKERNAVLERMRTERGFTILFRHADKLGDRNDRKSPITTINISECDEPKQLLNDHGVRQADIVRAAFDDLGSRLDVRIDQVTASNSCRALETARIAFGVQLVRMARDKDLNTGNEDMLLRERVRMDIGTINRVLVSHSGQITTALNMKGVRKGQLGCGEAAVLKFESGAGEPSCLARVLPEEWSDPSFELPKRYYRHTDCPAGALSARSAN